MLVTYILLGVILIPGIIYAITAQAKVQNTFKVYSDVPSAKGLTAREACEKILKNAGINDVKIQQIDGNLTDNYNPSNKTLSLSTKVCNSTSIAALGVAAHEAGHAIQHAQGYGYLKLRNALAVVSNAFSNMMLPLLIVALILSALSYTSAGSIFAIIGCAFFGLSVIFSLVTLPVEFNASNRALDNLVSCGALDNTEVKGAKQVLSAAAQTYVASLVISILSFLRFLLALLISRE